jgi:hypothetical protein
MSYLRRKPAASDLKPTTKSISCWKSDVSQTGMALAGETELSASLEFVYAQRDE